MNSVKNYIGKGKQVKHLEIVKVSIKLEQLEAIAYEMKGVKYVSFEVAKLKESDQYGHTHTCYTQVLSKTNEKKPR